MFCIVLDEKDVDRLFRHVKRKSSLARKVERSPRLSSGVASYNTPPAVCIHRNVHAMASWTEGVNSSHQ